MAIRALIFDVGGVLLQLPNDTRQRQWEAQFNLAEGAIAQALWGSDLSALLGVQPLRSKRSEGTVGIASTLPNSI